MRPSLLRAAALAAALAAAACGPRLPEGPDGPSALLKLRSILQDAEGDLKAGRWDDAEAKYRAAADAAGDDPNLGGWRDTAVYNLACVHARAGRRAEAASAFREAVAHGLRARRLPDRSGNWTLGVPGISLAHVLADPDLDSIRGEAAFEEALRPYLGGGGEGVGWRLSEVGAAAEGERLPVLVSMTPLNVRVVHPGQPPALVPVMPEHEAWATLAPDARFVLCDARGPVCDDPPAEAKLLAESPAGSDPRLARRWMVEDGDERWAVAHLRRILDAIAASPRADPDRVVLFAEGRDAATAAWAAAVAMPERVAGVCAIGAAFHGAAWADDLAAMPAKRTGKSPWIVIVGPGDDAAAEAMASLGIEASRSAPGAAPRAAVEALAPR